MAYVATGKPRGRKGFVPYKKLPPVVRGSAFKLISNPSSEQLAVINHIANSNVSLVCSSRAGTGKTAVAVHAMSLLPRDKKILYIVFANKNAREAEARCQSHIEISTCHSFGLRALRARYGKVEVCSKGEKDEAIASSLWGYEPEKADLRYNFTRAVSLAKGQLCETSAHVKELVDKFEIDMCEEKADYFADQVMKAMDIALEQWGRASFDDLITTVIKNNISVPQYQFITADEVQDVSPARRELILRALAPNGVLFAIGDREQQIFSFAGSTDDSMDKLIERTNADTLTLNTTFRCAKSIVRLAQEIVPDYVAADSNQEGIVETKTATDMMREAMPGDFILSRTNAPLIGICLQFLKEGRKCCVMGKDLGRNLTYMLKRSQALDVNEFLVWLNTWESNECERLIKTNKPCDQIKDKADTLRAFCEGINDLSEAKRRIESMFDDEDENMRITAATAHKSKGAEKERVWLLRKTFKPEKGGEEGRIYYVAITRAKNSLFIINN